MDELVDDAFVFLVAGSDTTAYALSCATYYLLTYENCQHKLKEELNMVPKGENGELAWKDVADLPYLTAVVKEALRISSSVPSVLPRVVPSGGAHVQGQFIPAGTIVSISQHSIQHNPSIFQSPSTFDPDRWLGEKGKELEKWHIAFSKGPEGLYWTKFGAFRNAYGAGDGFLAFRDGAL